MLGENGEQFDNGAVLSRGEDAAFKIGLLEFIAIGRDTPFGGEFGSALKLCFGGWFAENLAGLEEANGFVAKVDGNSGIAEAVGAGNGMCLGAGAVSELLLGLEAGCAGAAFFCHEAAKTVFASFPVKGQLPGLDRAEGYGEAGGIAEGALVIVVDFGARQLFDYVTVSIHRFFRVQFVNGQICSNDDKIREEGGSNNW